MLRIKQHIAIVLLWVFLLPQLAGAFHYLVVEHRLAVETKVVLSKGNPEVDNHACMFHLKAFSSYLLVGSYSEIDAFPDLRPAESCFSFQNYDKTPAFNFLLRGPPVVFDLDLALQPLSGNFFKNNKIIIR